MSLFCRKTHEKYCNPSNTSDFVPGWGLIALATSHVYHIRWRSAACSACSFLHCDSTLTFRSSLRPGWIRVFFFPWPWRRLKVILKIIWGQARAHVRWRRVWKGGWWGLLIRLPCLSDFLTRVIVFAWPTLFPSSSRVHSFTMQTALYQEARAPLSFCAKSRCGMQAKNYCNLAEIMD